MTMQGEVDCKTGDLAVVYRLYPLVSKDPFLFGDSKFDLARQCLKSFADGLGSLRVKIWVLLDGCPAPYEDLCRELLCRYEYQLIKLPGVGGVQTFEKQIEILCSQTFSENVYLAEDDYLYSPKSIEVALQAFLEIGQPSFMTLYDSADYYSMKFHEYERRVTIILGSHWQAVSCTTFTFMATKTILNETKTVFSTYASGNFDSSIWMSLTKKGIWNFSALTRFIIGRDRDFIRIAKAWLFGWKQIVSGKTYQLLSPIPSLATHLERESVAPVVDWMAIVSHDSE